MKLRNIRNMGRYINPETGKPVNVKTGNRASRGTDHLFFLRSGKRVFISDVEFWSKKTWERVDG